MARLIDADALKAIMFDYAPPEMMWDRGDIEHKIDEQPTIDAIPVEWLQKMRDKMNHAFEPHFAFMYVLQEWERTKTIEELQAESEMRDWKAEQEDEKWAHD